MPENMPISRSEAAFLYDHLASDKHEQSSPRWTGSSAASQSRDQVQESLGALVMLGANLPRHTLDRRGLCVTADSLRKKWIDLSGHTLRHLAAVRNAL